MMRVLVTGLFLLFASVSSAMAAAATLIADQITVTKTGRIIASGAVEVFFEGQHLSATSVIYDEKSGSLEIGGPLILTSGEEVTIIATAAELSDDLKLGILKGARLIINEHLQVAASEIRLKDERYTHLRNSVATTCRVCASNPTPIWQIRARDIIHDDNTKRLYFNHATFEVLGVPVFYSPRLSIPDPSVKRATGFLVPRLKTSSLLGTLVEIPYFLTFGDHADLTLAPAISKTTTTLHFRYRQAYRTGRINVDGSLSDDRINSAGLRGYMFSNGQFQLPAEFALTYNLQATTDQSYLTDYGISGQDRLESNVEVTRTRATENMSAGFFHYSTLRGSELAIDDELPNLQAELSYERLFHPAALGGQISVSGHFDAHRRASTADVVGRDQLRLTTAVEWRTAHVFGPGLIGETSLGGSVSTYQFANDAAYQNGLTNVRAHALATLRWPLARTGAAGTSVLEPVVQIGWAEQVGSNPANEDSTLVEIGPGNLLQPSRFPGLDRFETGARGILALNWTYTGTSESHFQATVARIFRIGQPADFSDASGLKDKISDWILWGGASFGHRTEIDAHVIISGQGVLKKFESRMNYAAKKWTSVAAMSWMIADPAENRNFDTAQLSLDGSYKFNKRWLGTYGISADFQALTPTVARLGLQFSTDCAAFNLSLSRRFTSSVNIQPNTDVGLKVSVPTLGRRGTGALSLCNG